MKPKRRRKTMRTKLFVLLVLVSMILTACGGGAAAPTSAPVATQAPATQAPATQAPVATEAPATQAPAGEKVELTLGSWRVDDVDAWTAITKAFNEEYPNITVKFDPTNPPDYNATLRTQLETGTAPDLFFVRSFATGQDLFAQGFVASLKDLPGLTDSFSTGSLAPWASESGEPFAVPIAAVSHGIYYNQDLFEANDIAVPTTWEELMAAAENLQAAGVTPFANGTKDEWDINEVVLMSIIPNEIGGLDG